MLGCVNLKLTTILWLVMITDQFQQQADSVLSQYSGGTVGAHSTVLPSHGKAARRQRGNPSHPASTGRQMAGSFGSKLQSVRGNPLLRLHLLYIGDSFRKECCTDEFVSSRSSEPCLTAAGANEVVRADFSNDAR